MAADADKIEVLVTGAVAKGGYYQLAKPATLSSCLDVAKGLAPSTPKIRPSGDITVRRSKRPTSPGEVDTWRFNLNDGEEWKTFELRGGEVVIFRWDVSTLRA